jgi:hypothetical protein
VDGLQFTRETKAVGYAGPSGKRCGERIVATERLEPRRFRLEILQLLRAVAGVREGFLLTAIRSSIAVLFVHILCLGHARRCAVFVTIIILHHV